MKFIFGILCALFFIPSISLALPVKVGVIVAQSGELAGLGDGFRKSLEFGLAELPEIERSRIELYFEDDQFKAAQTVPAYERLKAAHGIDVLVVFGSSTAKAVAPRTEAEKIPLIALATDPQVNQGRSSTVNMWATPETLTDLAVSEAERRGYRRIARIASQHDFTDALKRTFDAAAVGRVTIDLDESYPRGACRKMELQLHFLGPRMRQHAQSTS